MGTRFDSVIQPVTYNFCWLNFTVCAIAFFQNLKPVKGWMKNSIVSETEKTIILAAQRRLDYPPARS